MPLHILGELFLLSIPISYLIRNVYILCTPRTWDLRLLFRDGKGSTEGVRGRSKKAEVLAPWRTCFGYTHSKTLA